MGTVKSIEKEITEYLAILNPRQKRTVLSVVKSFAEGQKDWWDEISEEQQKAIDEALVEMKAGKLTPHEEVMKKYSKWLKK
jgi:predicted transcriptional regulator